MDTGFGRAGIFLNQRYLEISHGIVFRMKSKVSVWRWTPAITIIMLVLAVSVVTIEWLARQLLDQNVWLGWIEIAGILSFLCVTSAIPFVSRASTDLRLARSGVLTGHNIIAVIGASFLAVYLGMYAQLAAPELGRLFYADFVTLRMPAIIMAIAAIVLAGTEGHSLYIRCIGRRQYNFIPHDHVTLSFATIIAAALLGLLIGPRSQQGYLLLGQTTWNLMSQDDFLALVLISCLLELNFSADNDQKGLSWNLSGAIIPLIPLTLIAALILGIRGAEAMATMLIPAVGLAIGAGLIATFSHSTSSGAPKNADHQRNTGLLNFGLTNARILNVVSLIAMAILVLLGYARPVEAIALASAFFLMLILLANDRRKNVEQLMEVLPQHIGATGLLVLAGGFLYLSSGVTGFQTLISNGVEWSGINLISIVVCLFFTTVTLSGWLKPCGLFIAMLPIAPIAMQTSGASIHQTFALVTVLVVIAPIGYRFIHADVTAQRWPIFAMLTFSLVILFAVATYPQVVEFLPMRTRFW